ncbi:hypothetical protein ACC680_37290, partial [Rhizobium ruizarguesonis]
MFSILHSIWLHEIRSRRVCQGQGFVDAGETLTFDSAGIEKRHAARPLAWCDEPHGWQDRMQALAEGAGGLFGEAA